MDPRRIRRSVFEEALKAEIKGVLAGHSVAMVTYCVTKIIPTCSPMAGQSFLYTMIVVSIDSVVIMTHQNLSLETTYRDT